MAGEGKKIKCPWCGEGMLASEVNVGRHKGDYGTVVERKCAKCSNVLAAYLEEEGDFFPRIRVF